VGTMSLLELDVSSEFLDVSSGTVRYSLTFGRDVENYIYIQGKVEAEVVLECQRCLGPLKQLVHSEFCLSPVETAEAAAQLPERYEAVFTESGSLSLRHLVEEELLLSLPVAPSHEGACYPVNLTQH